MQPIAGFAGAPRRAPQARRYTGRRINIDIKDGDIHNILRLLAKEGNVNIVTSDDVKGSVTVHLKLVPWDQALDIILQTKGLGMIREGDIVRVAPAEVLAKERDLELQQQEVKEKLKPLLVKLITVNYASASDLLPRVRSVLSERGKAEFDERTNTVIVKDVQENVEAAEDIVSRLDTQTPQVLIEARIVEVNTVDSLQLGIQWGGNALASPALGNGTGLRFPSVVGVRGAADDAQTPSTGVSTVPNFVVNLPAAAGGGSGGALGLTFGSIDGAYNLNVRLSAFENRGTVKIVSARRSRRWTTRKPRSARASASPSARCRRRGRRRCSSMRC
ncbi:MAG: secretin N-terminal domain-containing protein [bacterium]